VAFSPGRWQPMAREDTHFSPSPVIPHTYLSTLLPEVAWARLSYFNIITSISEEYTALSVFKLETKVYNFIYVARGSVIGSGILLRAGR
jgi:hypothetical protein